MKVLQVITGLHAGGAELQLAMLLRRSRHDADVVTLYNPGPIADQIRADGTSVRDLGMRRNTEFGALPKLYRIIRDGQYDVVHAHLFRSQIYARPAAWLAGTPVIVTTEHSIGETHIERREMTSAVRALYLASELFSDATIAVSEVVRERLVRWSVPERKVTVIPNGLDADALAFRSADRDEIRTEFGIPAGTYVIGTVGRLDPIKRIDLMIEAAAPLLGNHCKILVVGPGPEEDHLRATAARLDVADHVIFAGYRSDTHAMLAACDLYIAASSQETFGLSVLEALASGLPVLYTACPALDGIRTERARQVEGRPDALRSEISKELEAGPRSREPDLNVLERYGAESTVGQIDDLYEQILATRPRSRRRARARRAALAAAASSAPAQRGGSDDAGPAELTGPEASVR